MAIISENNIDDICLEIMDIVKNSYPYYVPHLYFMYHYGVRIGEVFDYRIQLDASGNNIEIQAQKNNNIRQAPPADFTTFLILEKLHYSQNNQWLNKKNLERIIKKIMPIRNLKVGNKNVGAHLFRHNYIKKLRKNGLQSSTIDAMLGYTTQSISDTYAISKIYH